MSNRQAKDEQVRCDSAAPRGELTDLGEAIEFVSRALTHVSDEKLQNDAYDALDVVIAYLNELEEHA